MESAANHSTDINLCQSIISNCLKNSRILSQIGETVWGRSPFIQGEMTDLLIIFSECKQDGKITAPHMQETVIKTEMLSIGKRWNIISRS